MARRRGKRRRTAPARRPVSEFSRSLGHSFRRTALLEQALTHGSYRHDHEVPDYERLEFLGDAALGLVVTEAMHFQRPEWTAQRRQETKSAVVSNQSLAEAARALSLDDGIRVGRGPGGDDSVRSSDRILANVFEAVLGAAYLDLGLPAARGIVAAAFARKLRRLGLEPPPASPGAGKRLALRVGALPAAVRRFLRRALALRKRPERSLGYTFARPALLETALAGEAPPAGGGGGRRRRGGGRVSGRSSGRSSERSSGRGSGRRGGRRRGPGRAAAPAARRGEGEASVGALRFLGRDVMQLAAADALHTRFPEWDEGRMTLARMRLQEKDFWSGLGRRWALGRGEAAAPAAEAALGALYLDGRLPAARRALRRPFAEAVEGLDDPDLELLDPKTLLQNRLAKAGRDAPRYEVLPGNSGGLVAVRIHLEGGLTENGRGRGLKEAEKDAARRALARLYGRAKRVARPESGAAPGGGRGGSARPAPPAPPAVDNPKGALQTALVKQERRLPAYRLISESGPEHAKTYVVEVVVGNRPLGRGSGSSRRKAEAAAAAAALAAGL